MNTFLFQSDNCITESQSGVERPETPSTDNELMSMLTDISEQVENAKMLRIGAEVSFDITPRREKDGKHCNAFNSFNDLPLIIFISELTRVILL